MTRPVVCAVALLVLSCTPPPKPAVPEPRRVWSPSARSLHNSYVDGDDRRYTGETVQIHLAPHSYGISATGVVWHGGDPKGPPDIVFVCNGTPPKDTKDHLIITGICKGRVWEPEPVGWRNRFHVRIEVTDVSR